MFPDTHRLFLVAHARKAERPEVLTTKVTKSTKREFVLSYFLCVLRALRGSISSSCAFAPLREAFLTPCPTPKS